MASVVDGNGGSGGLVVTELGHIKELVTQLEVHLGGSSPDLCKQLASQISSITERSISLLITTSTLDGARKRSAAAASPLSDASDAPFVKATKKRKTKNKQRHEVRVSTAGGDGDHPADDGHSWRKYGQKEILGAKHPRTTMDKKRHEVRVSSAGDHPDDDGQSWRKYGQKEILGAKHPRLPHLT